MATNTEKKILRKKLEKYEGRLSHMYLDTKGKVTIGIGNLISNVTAAYKLTLYTIYLKRKKSDKSGNQSRLR